MYRKLYFSASLIVLLSLTLSFTIPITVSAAVPKNSLEVFAQGLTGPFGLAFDKDGNLYVANEGTNGAPFIPGTTISKITPDGQVSTYADGFNGPAGLAFDKKGDLWVSDDHGLIWKISSDGTVTPGSDFPFPNPNGLSFDKHGNLFVACTSGGLYKISPTGTVSLFFDRSIDNIMFQAIAFDKAGNVYVADSGGTIYKIDPSGYPVDVFSEGVLGFNYGGLVFDKEGNLYASGGYDVYFFTPEGTGRLLISRFQWVPRGLVFDKIGRLYISEYDTGIIWRLTTTNIKFGAQVVGECGVTYGPPGAGFPDPVLGGGIGRGTAGIDGRAETVSIGPWWMYEDAYLSERIDAKGHISVRWTEQDGSEGYLVAVLYSTDDTEGVFMPDEDRFDVPIPATLESPPLEFRGVYQSKSSVQEISGKSLFVSGQYGGGPNAFIGILVFLYDEGSQTLFMVGWPRNYLPMPQQVFKSNVEITGSP